MSERTIYRVDVPESDRPGISDTPEAYRVVEETDDKGAKSVYVYGRYSKYMDKPEWVCNPSCRWLVGHLIGRLSELVELKEWRDSYE